MMYPARCSSATPDVRAPVVNFHQLMQDHLRFSIANFEETPEVDLDALLEDLCTMERDITKATEKLSASTKKSSTTAADKCDSGGSTAVGAANGCTTEENNYHDRGPQASREKEGGHVVPFTSSSTNTRVSSPVMVTHDVKERLESLQTEMETNELTPEEQEKKIKNEKMKIALEKMKAASFQKLFIKVYNSENDTNKTMMIDQTWTARDVTTKMMQKDDVEPAPNWCIIEKLPSLFMERILEDNEYVLQTVLDWSRETDNNLVFVSRRDKYMLFRNPQNFLLNDNNSTADTKLAEKSKDILLKEFFIKDSPQVPNSEGVLWLKEGAKKWSKHYFALRASGLYYNPKGKHKSRNLLCLSTFEQCNIYLGVGFKKKFKSPTEHVFCLKPPKVQTLKSKHIHCLCAEDGKTKEHWVTVIRMAKYGYSLYEDFLKTQEELESVLLHGSRLTIATSESGVTVSSSNISSSFSTDSSSNLSLNQVSHNNRLVRDRNHSFKTAPNRIQGKQNTLGSIFSSAWSKGLEDRNQSDTSSSMSSIHDSRWSPANSFLEHPSNTTSHTPFRVGDVTTLTYTVPKAKLYQREYSSHENLLNYKNSLNKATSLAAAVALGESKPRIRNAGSKVQNGNVAAVTIDNSKSTGRRKDESGGTRSTRTSRSDLHKKDSSDLVLPEDGAVPPPLPPPLTDIALSQMLANHKGPKNKRLKSELEKRKHQLLPNKTLIK